MAETQNTPAVDSGIVEMWRGDGRLYAIAGLIVGLVLGVIILPAIAALDNGEAAQAFLNDLAPEAVGILVTVFGIDQLNRRRSKREAEEALKQQLVMDAASISNEVAKNAVHQLWRKEWLHGENGLLRNANLTAASLQGAVLMNANLQGADLRTANLQDTNLRGTNLQGADLTGANLEGANLNNANLQAANLWEANLQGANLTYVDFQRATLIHAKLQGADLWHADLRGADLSRAQMQDAKLDDTNLSGACLAHANLQGVEFSGANIDQTTQLPDGTWGIGDMHRFVYPSDTNP